MQTREKVQPGCYLDNHRGHYIARDAILLAISFGFIVGTSDKFVVDMYDDSDNLPEGVEYPFEAIHELCDEAVQWLNSGDERMPMQNLAPIVPDGYVWEFNDGDFGIYSLTADERVEDADDEHDVCPDCGNTGTRIGPGGYFHCARYLSCWSD